MTFSCGRSSRSLVSRIKTRTAICHLLDSRIFCFWLYGNRYNRVQVFFFWYTTYCKISVDPSNYVADTPLIFLWGLHFQEKAICYFWLCIQMRTHGVFESEVHRPNSSKSNPTRAGLCLEALVSRVRDVHLYYGMNCGVNILYICARQK
jgi:hypothetical protein